MCRKETRMGKRSSLLGPVLLANGIVDLLCAAFLFIVPSLHRQVLVYQAFDAQGAYMAGAWGTAALALGVIRLWSSRRAQHHPAMLLLGLVEGLALALFTAVCILAGLLPLPPVLLPLCVGGVFGGLYVACLLRKEEA
jgi:hypothetical protein